MNLVIFVIGTFIGGLLHWVFQARKKSSGTFVIDMRDPENDQLFRLDWDEDLNSICTKKQIILDVKFYEG